jgi:hypothetical protein
MHRQAGFQWLMASTLAVAAPLAQAELVVYSATLSGAAEAPANATPGFGTATLTIDTLAHSMLVDVVFSGLLGNTTASHIHCCTAVADTGTAGVATQLPNFSGFPLGVTSGTYSNTFDLTLASSWNPAFITNHGGTPALAELDLLAGLDGEQAYLNIHTNQFPGGEIRGFLVRNVAEPGSLALVGLAVGGLMHVRRRGRTFGG